MKCRITEHLFLHLNAGFQGSVEIVVVLAALGTLCAAQGAPPGQFPPPPAGMSLSTVSFDTSCAVSGCWVLEGQLGIGSKVPSNNSFSTLFLPSASVGSGSTSGDFDYSAGGISSPNDVDVPVEWTFDPANHPCTSAMFNGTVSQEVSTCCITNTGIGQTGGSDGRKGGFLANYRTTTAFQAYGDGLVDCAGANGQVIESGSGDFPSDPAAFLQGKFSGMPNSPGVVQLSVQDASLGTYAFVINLEEVELRSKAGKLKGTVDVEHAVETFLGLSDFVLTDSEILDTFSMQLNMYLEKTSTYAAATHGTDDFAFLSNINMRLVSIEREGVSAAHYVQVSFLLSSRYGAVQSSELLPSEAVRAGVGPALRSTTMRRVCQDWADESFPDKEIFQSRLTQSCAPSASSVMCAEPTPDPEFVAFNIPLGLDFVPPPPDTPTNYVFIEMAISVMDTQEGQSQKKTVLSGSISVAADERQVFCAGFTGTPVPAGPQDDLSELVSVGLLLGTARADGELSRVQTEEDVAGTPTLRQVQVDSDSMEASLVTLVIEGDESYFEANAAAAVELEDVITLHMMESGGGGPDVSASVMALLTAPADGSAGSAESGYKLNGAFSFTVDASSQRAHLEPSPSLLFFCPFNPPRPADSMLLETCVTRRDVRYRGYPHRAGAYSTAMEMCVDGSCPTSDTADESKFMTTIFGDSTFARELGVDYSAVINTRYALNGRYRRAFWINPGYEWTPTLTGRSVFFVSQKLLLFALMIVDDGTASDDGPGGAPLDLPSRRRMLLQMQGPPGRTLADSNGVAASAAVEFETDRLALMVRAFGVPQDRVASFEVTLQLTPDQACMAPPELQTVLRAILDDHLASVASALHTMQVSALSVDRAGVQCTGARRADRALLQGSAEASARVVMLVVFWEGAAAAIDLARLQTMAGVTSAEPLSVSSAIDTSGGAGATTPAPAPAPAAELTHAVSLRVNMPYSLADFEANKPKIVAAFAAASNVSESQVSMSATEQDARRRLLASVDVDVTVRTASEIAATAVQGRLTKTTIDAQLAKQGLQPVTVVEAASVAAIAPDPTPASGMACRPSAAVVTAAALLASAARGTWD